MQSTVWYVLNNLLVTCVLSLNINPEPSPSFAEDILKKTQISYKQIKALPYQVQFISAYHLMRYIRRNTCFSGQGVSLSIHQIPSSDTGPARNINNLGPKVAQYDRLRYVYH